MNVMLPPAWTQEAFFAWAAHQEGRYEFDGVGPVDVTGGSVRHGLIMRRLFAALEAALGHCDAHILGPEVGIATVGRAIRYPDALITVGTLVEGALTVPKPMVVFEIVSPNSQRNDRIVKVREYLAVASITRYVILEYASIGATVFEREAGDSVWRAAPLTDAEELVSLPEFGVELPLGAIYRGVTFDGAPDIGSDSDTPPTQDS